MRRIIYGLLMLGGFALVAAPAHAGFDLNLECNNSYAVEMHGTEPSLTNDAVLHYIAGVGQVTFGAETGGLGGTCPITKGELIYNDNDVLTLSAGPAACYIANSLLGGGIPCFDGAVHITGSLSGGKDGGAKLAMVASFGWTDGAPAASSLALLFDVQTNFGLTVIGNTESDPGPAPTSPPPGSPVLALHMEKQSTTVSLPVTGPLPPGAGIPAGFLSGPPITSTGGGGNGYGVAPYLGLTVSLFQGYGAPSSDLFAQPITGSFGTTVSSLQIFASGQSGGSVSFNSNDSVGNTTGATNADCDVVVSQSGNFADGASNNLAAIVHPSLTCLDAAALATFELGNVVWGGVDANAFSIVTGLSASTLTSGLLIPAGLMSDATVLQSVPAGGLTNLVSSTLVAPGGTIATPKVNHGYTSFFSTTPAGCDVSIAMPTGTSANGNCTLDLGNAAMTAYATPQAVVVEGDTFGSPNPFVKYADVRCTCHGSDGAAASTISETLTVSASDCPNPTSVFGTSGTVTCKN